MKAVLIAALSLFLFFGVALAEEEVYNDNSVQAYIDLGNGDGAIIILGDGNTIYLPDNNNDNFKIIPNEVTFSEDKTRLVMMDTEIISEGVVTTYKKIVLILKPDGWELVWWEQ